MTSLPYAQYLEVMAGLKLKTAAEREAWASRMVEDEIIGSMEYCDLCDLMRALRSQLIAQGADAFPHIKRIPEIPDTWKIGDPLD